MPNDEYQLGELLGRGGMGQVHVARHRSGRLVAVKRVRNTLSNDRLVVDRLSDEARLLGTVAHPNVVRALDHGTSADGMPFLVMDRAHGTPLNQLVTQHGPLPHDRMIAIASQLFAGLTAIHEANVVHADLKSHNVLVDDVNIVTIIDFGLARTVTTRTTGDGFVAGTPAYMAPEAITGGPPTVAGDIYAAGAVLYEMLTGGTPYAGHISTILTRQLSERVEPPSQRAPGRGIPAALDGVVLRALEAAPAARFRTVRELAAAFAAAFPDEFATTPRMARGSALWLERPTVRRPQVVVEILVDHELARGDAQIEAALASARRLIEARDVPAAIEALEISLASLAPSDEADPPICASAWRIETVLAALYDSIGKPQRARRMALVAYRHALHTGCPLAEARAGSLVDRLVARPRRIARGSSGQRR
jgi:serine/threonine protein kinase